MRLKTALAFLRDYGEWVAAVAVLIVLIERADSVPPPREPKPEQTTTEKTATGLAADGKAIIPLLALAGVIFSVAPTLTALQILHSLREKCLLKPDKEMTEANLDVAYREAMLWNSYVPMLAGWCVFFFLVAWFALGVPSVFAVEKQYRDFLVAACRGIAVVFSITFVGFLIGGIGDARLMKRAIRVLRENAARGTPPPALGVGRLRSLAPPVNAPIGSAL